MFHLSGDNSRDRYRFILRALVRSPPVPIDVGDQSATVTVPTYFCFIDPRGGHPIISYCLRTAYYVLKISSFVGAV